jgi:hypothetical protein
MLPLQRVIVLLTLVAGLSAGLAHADSLVQFDGFSTGAFSSGTDNGFTIGATNASIWSGGFPGNSAGENNPGVTATFTFTDGGAFTFLSLEIAKYNALDDDAFPAVTVEGYSGATLLATDSFSVPSGGAPGTFDADNLAGLSLTSLVVSASSNYLGPALIDDLDFDSPTPTATPEPATISMLGAGVCAILAARRGQNRKAQTS